MFPFARDNNRARFADALRAAVACTILLIIALAGPVAKVPAVVSAAPSTPPPPLNLELAGDEYGNVFWENGIAAFGVREEGQGEDLNGDGDMGDTILHIYHHASGVVENTEHPLVESTFRPICLEGQFLAFVTREDQREDYNGDGDMNDRALALWNLSTGADYVNVIAAGGGVACGGGRVAFVADEYGDGRDYNGDLDLSDRVWHVFEISTRASTNLKHAQVAGMYASAKMNDRALVFETKESLNSRDSNDDGDQDDLVILAYPFTTGSVVNHEMASFMPVDDRFKHTSAPGRYVSVLAPEYLQGPGADHNGDGDTNDMGIFAIDTRDGSLITTGMAGGSIHSASRWLTMFVRELEQGGTDYNGDGDTFDTIVMFHNVANGSVWNTERAASDAPNGLPRPHSSHGSGHYRRIVVSEISESRTGMDLNGDGFLLNDIIQIFDPRTKGITSPEAQSSCMLGEHDVVAVNRAHIGTCKFEALHQPADENGDGDFTDMIAGATWTRASGSVSTGRSMDVSVPMRLVKHRGFFISLERDERKDFNNDGDTIDRLLHSFDLDTGELHNYVISVAYNPLPTKYVWANDDEALVFLADERADGVDYNGDGDTYDHVVHVVR